MSCKRVYKNQWDKKVLERDMLLKSSGISEIMSLAFFATMYPYMFLILTIWLVGFSSGDQRRISDAYVLIG